MRWTAGSFLPHITLACLALRLSGGLSRGAITPERVTPASRSPHARSLPDKAILHLSAATRSSLLVSLAFQVGGVLRGLVSLPRCEVLLCILAALGRPCFFAKPRRNGDVMRSLQQYMTNARVPVPTADTPASATKWTDR